MNMAEKAENVDEKQAKAKELLGSIDDVTLNALRNSGGSQNTMLAGEGPSMGMWYDRITGVIYSFGPGNPFADKGEPDDVAQVVVSYDTPEWSTEPGRPGRLSVPLPEFAPDHFSNKGVDRSERTLAQENAFYSIQLYREALSLQNAASE
jgi:hypothetical protein